MMGLAEPQGLAAVARLGDDLDAGEVCSRERIPARNRCMVVGQQDPDRLASSLAPLARLIGGEGGSAMGNRTRMLVP